MGLYSLLLTLGPVPVQIVLLYARVVVRATSYMLIAVASFMLAFTLFSLLWEVLVNGSALVDFLFVLGTQLVINGPTLIFLIPFLLYLKEVDNFLALKYPNLYDNNNLFFQPKPLTVLTDQSTFKIVLIK